MRISIFALLALAGLVTFQRQIVAAPIFQDTFDSTGATRNNDANDPSDILWVTRGNNAAAFGVVSDAAGIGTGKSLEYASDTGAQVIFGSFDNAPSNNDPALNTPATDPPRPLGNNAGDTLRLRFNFRFVGKPSTFGGNVFRFGLYGDPDDSLSTDNTTTITNNARGYYGTLSAGTAASGIHLYREDGSNNTFVLNDSGDRIELAQDPNRASIDDTIAHVVQLELNRLAGGSVGVKLYLDDLANPALTSTDSTPFTDFSLLAIQVSGDGLAYRLDNVTLDVPEPSILALAAMPLAALLFRRRDLRRRGRTLSRSACSTTPSDL